MRTVFLGLAVCVTCRATPVREVEVVVPSAAFHPQIADEKVAVHESNSN